jgi:hypothetical protein
MFEKTSDDAMPPREVGALFILHRAETVIS